MLLLMLSAQLIGPVTNTECDKLRNQPKQQLACLNALNEKHTTALRNRLAAHQDYEDCVYRNAERLASEPEPPSTIASVAMRYCTAARVTLGARTLEQAEAFGEPNTQSWEQDRMKEWDEKIRLEAIARVIASRRGDMLGNP